MPLSDPFQWTKYSKVPSWILFQWTKQVLVPSRSPFSGQESHLGCHSAKCIFCWEQIYSTAVKHGLFVSDKQIKVFSFITDLIYVLKNDTTITSPTSRWQLYMWSYSVDSSLLRRSFKGNRLPDLQWVEPPSCSTTGHQQNHLSMLFFYVASHKSWWISIVPVSKLQRQSEGVFIKKVSFSTTTPQF